MINASRFCSAAPPFVAVGLLCLALVGCTPSGLDQDADAGSVAPEGNATVSPIEMATPTEDTVDPNDVPRDDTDYSTDAGNNIKEYEYPDDPEPADTVVATLCNLNQGFFRGLRNDISGSPVVDEMLRTGILGLSDMMEEWEALRVHFPDSQEDIDRAEQIFDAWDQALLSNEDGDEIASQELMEEAELLIADLPLNSDIAECK